MILFFDTETTGKALFKESPSHPNQPHIVQLAILAYEFDEQTFQHQEVACANFIIKPTSAWKLSPEAEAIHGISLEKAQKYGVDIKIGLALLRGLGSQSSLTIGHNVKFDLLMVDIELARLQKQNTQVNTFCTMEAMTNICKLPGKFGFKWPKLQEAYKHAFGKEFEGAHDALADIRATAEIYFWLRKQNV